MEGLSNTRLLLYGMTEGSGGITRVLVLLCEFRRCIQAGAMSDLFALVSFQAPLSRFGDTAANAGIFALLDSLTWPVLVKTVFASLSSATFRMSLTPIDTLKTTQQTQGGVAGLKLLRERIRDRGVGTLWYGALATAAATFVGNCAFLTAMVYKA